jgi:hypothetical protein
VSDNSTPPLLVERVIAEEYAFLHGPATPASSPQGRGIAADEIVRRHAEAGHSALCLSGGGVRSASFGLGVLQGLARAGVLGKFDYLSTVSGGGYVGGWLSAWRLHARRDGAPDPCEQLGHDVEPEPLSRLRLMIKFLDPRTGMLSADVWTLGGTMLRNLLVNWMVLIPLIAAIAMLPTVYLGLLGLPSQPELVSRASLDWWYANDWIPLGLLIGIATTYAAMQLPSLGHRADGSRSFAIWFLSPVLLSFFLLSVHRYWAWRFGDSTSLGLELVVSAVAMVVPWFVGGAFSKRWWRPWTWAAAATAGLVGRFVSLWTHHFLTALAHHDPHVFVVVDLPVSLALLFLQITVFIGLASRDMTDDDREWWARAGAWILIVGLSYLVASGIAILGPMLLDAAIAAMGLSRGGGRAGVTLLTIASGATVYRVIVALASQVRRWPLAAALILCLAAPATAVLLLVLVSDGNRHLLGFIHDLQLFHEQPHPVGASLPEDLLALFSLLVLGVVLGRVISINQFSLHGMYRSRLVRTFLGTSRPKGQRHPSPFTGFDAADDVTLDRLQPLGRPLHVVNTTLNLVSDSRLSEAERRATSLTMSPLHVGSWQLGYRPAAEYASGITLGNALTTSGAAVSSNMGANASRPLTFLLTVFNARLGIWLGNPGPPGAATWTRPAPAFGAEPLVDELLARTTETNPYVYLSDGGHFENLGLYEMVLRRCRYIVVSDAGCDVDYTFGDLANAVRKIRIDFGIDIDFPAGLHIGPHQTARFAVGTIWYSRIDSRLENGILVYVKPTVTGTEDVDVANYAAAHPTFPHQSTTEQWFDEAQFESYRVLGLQTIAALCGNQKFDSLRDLCLAASQGRS